MFNLRDGKYVVKTVGGESSAKARSEAEGLIGRAIGEGFDLSNSDLIGAEESEIQVPNKITGELVVDNSKINREAHGEAYLTCGPELSGLPPFHPSI
jgi:hypothetical protein